MCGKIPEKTPMQRRRFGKTLRSPFSLLPNTKVHVNRVKLHKAKKIMAKDL